MALNQGSLMKAVDWAYERSLNGVAGLESAQELAASYTRRSGTAVGQSNALIRRQVAMASASGFLSGLGGVLAMPVTIPANLGSVLYVQLRMIAAIAYVGGHDARDDDVKTLAYLCLSGSAAAEVAKDVGLQLGMKMTTQVLRKLSGAAIVRINQKIGFRLVSKFGESGLINLGKAVPLVGGILGGAFDGVSTNSVGNVARKTFVEVPA